MGGAGVEAESLEKVYKWLEASQVYERALQELPENEFTRKGEVREKNGHCILKSACQAENHDDFRRLMAQAVEAYEKAIQLYERTPDSKISSARALHCRSVVSYVDFWLSEDPDSKRESLRECYRLEHEALRIYTEARDQRGIGETCVTLSNYLSNLLDLTVDLGERVKIMEEALSLGERAIKVFSDVGDERGLAEAYLITGMNGYDGAMSMDSEAKCEECSRKSFDYMKKAIQFSEKTGDKFLQGRSNVFLGFVEHDFGGGAEAADAIFRKALVFSNETRDRCLLSEAYDGLAYNTGVLRNLAPDFESGKAVCVQAMEYAHQAIYCSSLVDYGRGIPHAYLMEVNGYRFLASGIRTETKRELLVKAVALGKQGLEHAQRAGSSHASYHISLSALGPALLELSRVETGAEKRRTLEEAVSDGERSLYYTEQIRPFFMYVRGGSYAGLGTALLELSRFEEEPEKRLELLKKSVNNLETNVVFNEKHISSRPPRREVFWTQAYRESELAAALNDMYMLTKDKAVLGKMLQTLQDAVLNFERADHHSGVAEAHWQIALILDGLGEYLESSSNFESASKRYSKGADSIPQLRNLYTDYAKYMQAWCEIEKARQSHYERSYGEAKEHYEKAAELHGSTQKWEYLRPNYLAWSRLEEAEEFSRADQTEEARVLFEQAARQFREAEASINTRLNQIKEEDEARMADNVMKASSTRREYCDGRKAMEEARILDRQGDHLESSKRYGEAEAHFERMLGSLETESDRNEIRPIVFLCQAWQRMMMAEARDSPSLYGEAAELFMRAKDFAIEQSTSLLAQAHSSFCKALEIVTQFEMSRDTGLYSTAKRHIEAASSYYLRAGFQPASEYTTATSRLLDAYMYMYSAQTETDPVQKGRLYQLAERLLQSSAGSYIKAKHPEKSEEVRRILDQIREEKQIVMALTEIMHAPTVLSTTASFSLPTPSHEAAVGLERFKDADIQANMVIRDKELQVGQDFNLEIEIVNAGKASAQLIKVEEIIPTGFEIREAPDFCRVEDSYIDLKGRILTPLRTTEVKLVLKPKDKGTYQLRPRVLYLDESGKYKSHEPEPATITVRELGISGWLKGPTRDK